jgi:hypothetical protein
MIFQHNAPPSRDLERKIGRYADMIEDSKCADNKELMIIPDAVHTDLYDGGDKDYIPFDKLENFFKENLK